MAANSDDALQKQLERIDAKIDQMEQASARSKIISRLMTVLIALTAIIMVLLLVKPILQGTLSKEGREPYRAEFERTFKEQIQPMVQDEAKQLAKEVLPVYQEAAMKASETKLPKAISTFESEWQILYGDLQTDLQDRIQVAQEDIVEHQHKRLLEEFPDLKDEAKTEVVLGNLADASSRVSDRIITELFTSHYRAIDRLELNFNSIEVPDHIHSMNDDELGNHVKDLVAEMVALKLHPDTQRAELQMQMENQ
ncbi:hypothetical protein KQI84_17515 [bacterium]|nr:hypothetical protein [bacterium]